MEGLNIVVGGLLNSQSGKAIDTGYTPTGTAVNIDTTPNTDPWLTVPQYDYTWYAAYAQADYSPIKRIKLIAGAQMNKIDGIDASFSPRLGLILSANENLGMKILYGNAFRAPSAFERYSKSPNSVIGSSSLTPEKMTTFETQVFYNTNKLSLIGTYFFNHDDNNITRQNLAQTINGVKFTQLYVNSGYVDIQGLEFEAKYNFKSLLLQGSFTYQTSQDNLGLRDHTGIPQTMGKVGTVYNYKKLGSISLWNSYYGAPSDYFQNSASGATLTKMANPVASAYNYLSMNISYNLKEAFGSEKFPNIILNFMVNNLLDAQIYYPELARRNINTLPGRPGRAAYAGILFKF